MYFWNAYEFIIKLLSWYCQKVEEHSADPNEQPSAESEKADPSPKGEDEAKGGSDSDFDLFASSEEDEKQPKSNPVKAAATKSSNPKKTTEVFLTVYFNSVKFDFAQLFRLFIWQQKEWSLICLKAYFFIPLSV